VASPFRKALLAAVMAGSAVGVIAAGATETVVAQGPEQSVVVQGREQSVVAQAPEQSVVAQGFSPVSRGVIAQTQSPTTPGTSLRQLMLAAEDGRARTEAERAPLLQGIGSADPSIRRVAVRALGRLEQPALAVRIGTLLDDTLPRVRAEAANALGQAIVGSPGDAGEVSRRLLERLPVEGDPIVRGAICETLGRLPYSTAADVQAIEAALVAASWLGRVAPNVARQAPFEPPSTSSSARDMHDAPVPTLTGSLKGIESLFRLRRKLASSSPRTLERLRSLALGTRFRPASPEQSRVRRLALAALLAAGRPTCHCSKGVEDPDEQVGRIAAAASHFADTGDARARTIAVMALKTSRPASDTKVCAFSAATSPGAAGR
jgi:hypothetical protein